MVSLIALGALLYFADLHRLLDALRTANYAWIVLGVLISVVWLLVRGVVWRTLLLGQASYSKVFLTLNEGYLFNNLLPLRLGELARAFLLSRKTRLGFWQVISSILIERAMDLALAVGLLLISLPFVVGAGWAREAAMGAAGLILAVFVVLFLLARYRNQALSAFEHIGARWSFVLRLGGRAVPAFFTGLSVLTDARNFLRAVAWMLLNWAIAVAQYYGVMWAFFQNPRLLWVIFSLGVSALGLAAPSSPGALGVMELSLVGSLSVFGLDASTALAFAFTLHLLQYLTTGIIGGYALALDGESLAGLYSRLRSLRVEKVE